MAASPPQSWPPRVSEIITEVCGALVKRGDAGVGFMVLALENWHGGGASLGALRDFGESARPMVPALIADWRQGDVRPQRTELDARRLAAIGSVAVPYLTEAAYDLDPRVQLAAIAALRTLAEHTKLSTEPLQALLHEPDANVVAAARELLEVLARRSK